MAMVSAPMVGSLSGPVDVDGAVVFWSTYAELSPPCPNTTIQLVFAASSSGFSNAQGQRVFTPLVASHVLCGTGVTYGPQTLRIGGPSYSISPSVPVDEPSCSFLSIFDGFQPERYGLVPPPPAPRFISM